MFPVLARLYGEVLGLATMAARPPTTGGGAAAARAAADWGRQGRPSPHAATVRPSSVAAKASGRSALASLA